MKMADSPYNLFVMIRQFAEPLRHRSWVGIASSVTMHALVLAAVWVFTGTSHIEDPGGAGVRIVRLVAGEREVLAPKPAGPRVARRGAVTRPPVPRSVVPPVAQPSEPAPFPAPPSSAVPPAEPAVSTPETVAMSAEIPSAPVAAGPSAPVPAAEPRVEPMEPAAEATSKPPAVADASLPPVPEDGPALPLTPPGLRPELVRLQVVTAAATLSARAQGEPFLARREIFEFLLDHLEFATHLTRALRVARYRAWRTPEGLVFDDGWGALLNLSLVQATSGVRVVYARGQYRQPLLPNINGEAVVMIEYDTTPAGDGRDLVSAAVTSYVKVQSGFMSFLMKLASAAVTDKAEVESRRLVRVFARVSHAIEEDPAKVYDEVRRRPDVPQSELEEFRRLLRLP
jgi:hypothetical protein